MPRTLIESTMCLDRAVILEGELAFDQSIAELARLDLERLDIASDLLAGCVTEDRFEDGRSLLVRTATHQHDQMGIDGQGNGSWRGKREHHSREVDARRRSGNLTELDVLDEECSNDVHGKRP